MLNAQKITHFYKSAYLVNAPERPHKIDKYESQTNHNSNKRSLLNFKEVLQKELSKKENQEANKK
jgi:hypothetical protein